MQDQNTIIIKRDSGYADRLRAYKIILDGQTIGKINNGQEVALEIPTGSHKVCLKVDWCRSNIVTFDLGHDVVEFECGSSLRGIKVFLAIFYATLFANKYIWLKKVD